MRLCPRERPARYSEGDDVARSDLLRALLTAWSAGDDARFLTTAEQVIEDERRKGHVLMARETRDRPP